ncbi:orotidine-5'-phosphate decarboxylase [Arcanobacterium wilhelmae]|uniref:Orotidine 5'-phosphate decarboxylase n=1 Tax=Arcanobacterium wilhelmae TaxID=1803177 RepID=A0ABT9NAJ9_9ACTO|nr:orotidine-5'-phosphate decarboxylase [Arcanobacterium wilhelmae]MDP9800717.1 orotidine-5'-phosphate decarboxylase [Arcanobacterium wilhelmae]WFN90116.1 orotidine-5'-phosphate decarboxylase [Arcanobacterium wilhelmae]
MSNVIIACDFSSQARTEEFLDLFTELPQRPYVKVGMELFYGAGPQIVRAIKDRGHRIFLDLKLHDIPQTVANAMRVLSGLDVDMTNLHCGGGRPMMEAAIEGLTRPDGTRPLLIGVTQLTSTSEQVMHEDLLIEGTMADVVAHYAANAAAAGLDGVVCSPHESPVVHEALGEQFLTVTPGVRFPGAAADDQRRITSPAQARELGSNYIVMGRPITAAADPVAAYLQASKEFSND